MTRLHVFDMDGTLIPGTSASLELARHTGHHTELVALERRFSAGLVDAPTFARTSYALWSALTVDDVAQVWQAMPLLTGIAEVFADIRRRGEFALVVTLAPDFLARGFLGLGATEVVASRWPTLPFREPLDVTGILSPEDKPRIAAEMGARFGLTGDDMVGYGDSMSDAPLFRQLRHTVAVNADHHVADLAALTYRGDDLRAAYALVRARLDAETAPAPASTNDGVIAAGPETAGVLP